MNKDHCITVFRIDNGYLISYPNGETRTRDSILGPVEVDDTGTRYADGPEAAGQMITAMLKRLRPGAKVMEFEREG